LKNKIFV